MAVKSGVLFNMVAASFHVAVSWEELLNILNILLRCANPDQAIIMDSMHEAVRKLWLWKFMARQRKAPIHLLCEKQTKTGQ